MLSPNSSPNLAYYTDLVKLVFFVCYRYYRSHVYKKCGSRYLRKGHRYDSWLLFINRFSQNSSNDKRISHSSHLNNAILSYIMLPYVEGRKSSHALYLLSCIISSPNLTKAFSSLICFFKKRWIVLFKDIFLCNGLKGRQMYIKDEISHR